MAGVNAAFDVQVFDKPKNEGRIARKSGSRKLYLDFFYHGIRIEKSTGLLDTTANRCKAESWLNSILEMKRDGTFEFAKYFPAASEEEKEFHTRIEKGEYAPTPKTVTFGGYVKKWYATIWINFAPEKQKDLKSVIDFHLVPYFGKMTFYQITGVTLQQFVAQLVHRDGPKSGSKLARSTMVNILQVFKTIWDDAVIEHRWMLFDPQKGLKKKLPAKKKKKVDVFRFSEWEQLFNCINPYYQPVTKLMVLTGLIASEIAALKPSSIREGHLSVEEAIVKSRKKDGPKNSFREREIPITNAIGEILEQALKTATGEYLFTMESGRVFNAEGYNKQVWGKAIAASGVTYRKPYTTRHTFAAWALTLRVDQNRLVDLMGHASKQMIYEVYGKYTKGLEHDRLAIFRYFGRDFKKGA